MQPLTHTPTPWKVETGNGSYIGILNDKSEVITLPDWPVQEINAAFIVRAVNSHEALKKSHAGLLEALKVSKKCLKENRGPSLDEFKQIQEAIAAAEQLEIKIAMCEKCKPLCEALNKIMDRASAWNSQTESSTRHSLEYIWVLARAAKVAAESLEVKP